MYKTFVEDIDRWYKVEFGTLEIMPNSDSDEPMGLHAVAEEEPKEDEKNNINGQVSGPCNICNGEAYFARYCPPMPPVSPQAVERHGCHGRGRYKGHCPTANPHLKQPKGQGKGWGGEGKGKGYGRKGAGGMPWGGKGYGGKGFGGEGKGKSMEYKRYL